MFINSFIVPLFISLIMSWCIKNVFIFDGLSVLLLLFINFIHWQVQVYARQFLRTTTYRSRFTRATFILIAWVNLIIISANLWLTMLAWLGLSCALLYLFASMDYRNRARVLRRQLGYELVIMLSFAAATLCVYWQYGTADYHQLAQTGLTATPLTLAAIGLFFLSFLLRSGTLLGDKWFISTVNTPTPSSVILHAGVVNLSGYVFVRWHELFTVSPILLAIMAVVTLTSGLISQYLARRRVDVKRRLVNSTSAQMSYMLLQCSLGAYGFVIFHLIAHSCFKAYLFMNAGQLSHSPSYHGITKVDDSWRFVAGLLVMVSLLFVLSQSTISATFLLTVFQCLTLAQLMFVAVISRKSMKKLGVLILMVGGVLATQLLVMTQLIDPMAPSETYHIPAYLFIMYVGVVWLLFTGYRYVVKKPWAVARLTPASNTPHHRSNDLRNLV